MISIQRNAVILASFPHKYVAFLLPALIQVRRIDSRSDGDALEMEEKVRVAVDMALAVSADGFSWSRALKRKLERGAMSLLREMRIVSPVVRPLSDVRSRESTRGKKKKRSGPVTVLSGEDEDLRQSVRTLRRILPGGKKMGMCELICEVESYVTCLELQVGILQALLGAR